MDNMDNAFVVVWLDSNIEKSRNDLDTKALIRRMVRGLLFTFGEEKACINYLSSNRTNQRIIFIVSNFFGPKIVPLIHNNPQIHTIYIYCRNREIAQSWSTSFEKISNIFTNKQLMLQQIRDDIGASGKDDELPMSIFHLEDKQHSVQKISEDNAKFMWYQSILLVLRDMAKYCNSKSDMIEECRKNYLNDKAEEKKIKDFEDNYDPDTAFRWYSADSFIYRLLNKALRTQNIEIIFKFRFFINDLHNQIQKLYLKYLEKNASKLKNELTVYRGQCMTMVELESIKNNVNQIISMNSFLSATTVYEIAEVFADASGQSSDGLPLQSVLFIIELHNISKDTTPFASIQEYSCNPEEEEVLFTINAIFKVKSVTRNVEKNMWHVHLQLIKQENEVCRDVFKFMEKQIGKNPRASTFGWFLYRMSEFYKAERYTKFIIEQIPASDPERADAFNLLGLIYKDLKRYTDSIKCYDEALNIYYYSGVYNTTAVIVIHCNFALTYLAINDDRNAEKHQINAEEKLLKSSCKHDAILLALVATIKGKIQIEQGNYQHACENFQLALQKKHTRLPIVHPSIASTYIDIGMAKEKLGDVESALTYYTKAKEIREKSLPPDHLDIAECHANIARIYDLRKQHTLASKQYALASNIAMNNIRE